MRSKLCALAQAGRPGCRYSRSARPDPGAARATDMSNHLIHELRRQIDEDEQRLVRLGEPQTREHVLLLFSIERDLKERRRRLILLEQEATA